MRTINTLQDVKRFTNGNGVNLLLIKAKACGVCDAVLVKLQELLNEYTGVEASSVFIDEVPQISGEFLVFTAPTILVFFDGKEVLRESRFIRFSNIRGILDAISQ